MQTASSPPAVSDWLDASAWSTVELHSDVHLHAGDKDTFALWQQYLHGTQADCLIILGDLFELWVGDDSAAHDAFAQQCAATLRAAAAQRPVYFLHGNRDFLLGAHFAQQCGMQLLADPCVLAWGASAAQRVLLTHGDAWTLADTQYQAFRRSVRSPDWQADFLAKPLAERLATAAAMRVQSQMAQADKTDHADVDASYALAQLQAANARTLVHGHTHRPAQHCLDNAHTRWVLSDWQAAGRERRADYLRITHKQAEGALAIRRFMPGV